jgi:hypothetical protein
MIDTSLADPNRDVKRGIATYLTEIVHNREMSDLLRRHGAQDNPYRRAPHPGVIPTRPDGRTPDHAGPDRAE